MPSDEHTSLQIMLAKHIGRTYCETDKLVPLGRHGSFSVPPIPLELRVWAGERLCDIAWWVVANRLGGIDHAWLFGWPDATREPWGLVTEPYADMDSALDTVRTASEAMPRWDWGIEFYALRPEQGSWNPPSCVPIIAVNRDISMLIRRTMPIALDLKATNDGD